MRTTRIQTEYKEEIETAAERFGDHEDMNEARIVRWLIQFHDHDLDLAVRVIRAIRYVNGVNIRTMTKQLFEIADDELREQGFQKVALVPVGDAGAGSGTVVRVLREVIRGRSGFRVMGMLAVAKLQPGDVDAILFIDDFSGTGETLEKWWENVEPTVRPTNAAVYMGLLLLNEPARGRIETFAQIIAVEELAAEENVFHDDNKHFSAPEKETILAQCRMTGAKPRYEKGRGECGLLLSFKHGCPNNSLPILWHQSETWRALFKRSAI